MSECERCGKEHNGSYGSGRFCDSFCAHSHDPWNKGKTLGPGVNRGWDKRKQNDSYQQECEARRVRMRGVANRYWDAVRLNPYKRAERTAKVKATWARKKAQHERMAE